MPQDALYDGYAAAIPNVGEVLRSMPDPQGVRSWWLVRTVEFDPPTHDPELTGRPRRLAIELVPWYPTVTVTERQGAYLGSLSDGSELPSS